jgi:hypothetical protein
MAPKGKLSISSTDLVPLKGTEKDLGAAATEDKKRQLHQKNGVRVRKATLARGR